MTDETNELLVRARACGECQVCCITPVIDSADIQKEGNVPCQHSLAGGCDIYETRPQPCRIFYCGWRRSRDFPEDWRPDRSGIFAILEINKLPQYRPLAVALHLVGNPLRTIRRPDFIDFVIKNIRGNVATYLILPKGRGMLSARLQLNIPPVMEAAAKSRGDVKIVLEMILKRLTDHPSKSYAMEHHGHDVSADV